MLRHNRTAHLVLVPLMTVMLIVTLVVGVHAAATIPPEPAEPVAVEAVAETEAVLASGLSPGAVWAELDATSMSAWFDGVAAHEWYSGVQADLDRRAAERAARARVRSASRSTPVPAASVAPVGGNRALGQQMAAGFGWTGDQWSCLDALWTKESGWNHTVWNRQGSGAYGIPQALPGSKMASHGDDWRTNPATQIAWGLDYIAGRYGTPCAAWSHSKRIGWY